MRFTAQDKWLAVLIALLSLCAMAVGGWLGAGMAVCMVVVSGLCATEQGPQATGNAGQVRPEAHDGKTNMPMVSAVCSLVASPVNIPTARRLRRWAS